jgi:hypothetical protein
MRETEATWLIPRLFPFCRKFRVDSVGDAHLYAGRVVFLHSHVRIWRRIALGQRGSSSVGAGAGLGLSRYALGVMEGLSQGLPFWVRFELSSGAVIYAFGLAVLAALIMGVLPGLKATGASVSANLHELHGRGGTRLGATWTTLIVAQVAVAVLPAAVFIASRVIRMETTGPGFAAESIVVASAALSTDAARVDIDRVTARQVELISQLKREPGVIGVTFSSEFPGLREARRFASRRAFGSAGFRITCPIWASPIRSCRA